MVDGAGPQASGYQGAGYGEGGYGYGNGDGLQVVILIEFRLVFLLNRLEDYFDMKLIILIYKNLNG